MRIFGLEISRTKAIPPANTLSTPSSRGGWFSIIREPFAGAWQQNIAWSNQDVLTYAAVFSCITLIASDIAKLRVKLVRQDAHGIWDEVESAAFSPVLRKPNHYQTRIDFFTQWLFSLLIYGNAYILKERDDRRVVTSMYVLDPARVRPMVGSTGDVYYSLSQDELSGVSSTDVVVPAIEVMHDRINPLYHPLVGMSPLTACGLAAMQGLRVQTSSASFFGNGSRPGGILTFPRNLSVEEANKIRSEWEANYAGVNYGRVAVLAGELKYEPMNVMSAVDAQLIQQLGWTDKNVCMAFKVPAYMINAGETPTYNNVEALNQQYYSQCLQSLIEGIELRLDEGIGLDTQTPKMGTEFDLDSLLRMDTAGRVKAAADAVGSGTVTPNEARKRYHDLGPVVGGDTPYLQEQNYSLAALAKRDAQADPFGAAKKTPPPAEAAATKEDNEMSDSDLQRAMESMCRREWAA